MLRSEVSIHRTRSCTNLDFIVPRIKTCESGAFFYMILRLGTSFLVTSSNVKEQMFLKTLVKQHLLDKGLSKEF